MRKKGLILVLICTIAVGFLFGCSKHKMISKIEFEELFQNNESAFAAVAAEIWPYTFESAAFGIVDQNVDARDGNGNKIEISEQSQEALLSCLNQMEHFISEKYDPASFSANIIMRDLDNKITVIEFNIRDTENKVDSGIVYTTEQMDGHYIKMQDNWYLYFRGLA